MYVILQTDTHTQNKENNYCNNSDKANSTINKKGKRVGTKKLDQIATKNRQNRKVGYFACIPRCSAVFE